MFATQVLLIFWLCSYSIVLAHRDDDHFVVNESNKFDEQDDIKIEYESKIDGDDLNGKHLLIIPWGVVRII
jgi:hypothetical protein